MNPCSADREVVVAAAAAAVAEAKVKGKNGARAKAASGERRARKIRSPLTSMPRLRKSRR